MSIPGTLPAALAFVPSWWQETTDAAAFDALLLGWARACEWPACGFVWLGEPTPVTKAVQGGILINNPPPTELPDALRRLKGGETTVVYSLPGAASRAFAAVHPLGRVPGAVWAEKPAGRPWTDDERAYLALTGKALERSPAVVALLGPMVDADRLDQRLADAAVIAGRMAHDFDNLLQGIIGFSDLTLPLLQPGSQPANFVSQIGKVGQRGIVFTQQLHNLSRSGHSRPGPGSVPLAVSKEEARLRPITPAGVRLERDFPPNLPATAADTGPIQVVLGHLLENALEASAPGNVVRVAARAVELTDADAHAYLGRAAAGGHLQITVCDAGPGIKPEVRRRLFVEPFFTTKARHRGLGLAIAYRALCAHRGGIQFDSVTPPGTGTQVRVVLPLAADRPAVVAVTYDRG